MYCIFQLSEEFFDIVVLDSRGLGELAEALLYNVVAVCGGGGQVVEVRVKVRGQVGTIRETGEGSAGRAMYADRIGVNVVEGLDDICCAK